MMRFFASGGSVGMLPVALFTPLSAAVSAVLFLAIFVAISYSPLATAQSTSERAGFSEAEVKAAFVSHLFNFIRWPDGRSPEVVCVFQADAISTALSQLASAGKSRVRSIELVTSDNPDAGRCDALLMTRGQTLSEESAFAMDRPVLTISDKRGFAVSGGMVELERLSSRVGLVINRNVLESAGFMASSKLLSLSRVLGGSDD